MIDVVCRTNLDDYARVEWPALMVALPRLGDRVRSLDGKAELRVVGVTHDMHFDRNRSRDTPVPYVIVELHR